MTYYLVHEIHTEVERKEKEMFRPSYRKGQRMKNPKVHCLDTVF